MIQSKMKLQDLKQWLRGSTVARGSKEVRIGVWKEGGVNEEDRGSLKRRGKIVLVQRSPGQHKGVGTPTALLANQAL